MDENGATYDRMHLKDWFNNPHPLLKADVLDGVMRGLTVSSPEVADDHFVSDVSFILNKIFFFCLNYKISLSNCSLPTCCSKHLNLNTAVILLRLTFGVVVTMDFLAIIPTESFSV